MSARVLVSDVLLWLGCGGLVVAALGAVLARDVRGRLHHVAMATVVAAPLVVASLAVAAPTWRAAVKLLAIGGLVALSGPVTTAATARALATREDTSAADRASS